MSSPSKSGFALAKQINLYQQHLDKVFCDIVVKIQDEEFFVHSCIIAAACPKLHNLIEENLVHVDVKDRPQSEAQLQLDVFSPQNFEFILSYIYIGSLDWDKVDPEMVNDVLSAAHWCEFDQLVEDYMSMNRDNEVDHNYSDATDTIVMVDTFNDTGNELGVDDVKDLAADYYASAVQNQGVLFCIFCGEQFNTEDGMMLVEHMKLHKEEQQSSSDASPTHSKRNRRKASLGVKQKYLSLLPSSSNKNGVVEDSDYDEDDMKSDNKKLARIPMFKKDFACHICNKKLATHKALLSHLRRCEANEEGKNLSDSDTSLLNPDEDIIFELSNDPTIFCPRSTKGLYVQTGDYMRPYKKSKKGGKHGSRGKKGTSKEMATRPKAKAKVTKVWMCPQCPECVFHKKREQLEHIRGVHGVIKRYVCEHCGKDLDGKTALTLHMRIHTGERPYVCPQCGRGFSEKKTMEDHTRRHTGERPFLCTVCGKDFTFRQSLYRHMKFHSGQRPYPCDICGKAFVLKQNLQEHIARHMKHKLMKCTECQQQFVSEEMLHKHKQEAHIEETGDLEANIIDMTSEATKNMEGAAYEVEIEEEMLESYHE